ncbi:hypothetical protein DLAC_00056 [Tieghemostelium lacteum]|uniref:Uncharacterized protein n=1 Tax=Tieghemostelium lacteum TaxID=361077 RepID=A0A152A8N1_TIELA|nr:hypothetical protein DLAC_00056 [Tieghemostelium lacteum]|eukprot:KYR02609.1 hypothetical protein DLAC_00056 [Tieghemostelium lacteum]
MNNNICTIYIINRFIEQLKYDDFKWAVYKLSLVSKQWFERVLPFIRTTEVLKFIDSNQQRFLFICCKRKIQFRFDLLSIENFDFYKSVKDKIDLETFDRTYLSQIASNIRKLNYNNNPQALILEDVQYNFESFTKLIRHCKLEVLGMQGITERTLYYCIDSLKENIESLATLRKLEFSSSQIDINLSGFSAFLSSIPIENISINANYEKSLNVSMNLRSFPVLNNLTSLRKLKLSYVKLDFNHYLDFFQDSKVSEMELNNCEFTQPNSNLSVVMDYLTYNKHLTKLILKTRNYKLSKYQLSDYLQKNTIIESFTYFFRDPTYFPECNFSHLPIELYNTTLKELYLFQDTLLLDWKKSQFEVLTVSLRKSCKISAFLSGHLEFLHTVNVQIADLYVHGDEVILELLNVKSPLLKTISVSRYPMVSSSRDLEHSNMILKSLMSNHTITSFSLTAFRFKTADLISFFESNHPTIQHFGYCHGNINARDSNELIRSLGLNSSLTSLNFKNSFQTLTVHTNFDILVSTIKNNRHLKYINFHNLALPSLKTQHLIAFKEAVFSNTTLLTCDLGPLINRELLDIILQSTKNIIYPKRFEDKINKLYK